MEDNETGARLRRKTGRPRSFDRDAALEQAVLTFWRYGYESTSIVDLTTAMGVTAPSLYTAFGDKRRLFLEAAHRYAGDPSAMARAINDSPTAYDAARTMLITAAVAYTGDTTPKGCLLASATASVSGASSDVQIAIADIRKSIGSLLGARIEQDIMTGALSPATNAAAMAGLVMTLTQGMSVLARDGTPREALLAIVEVALQAWPRGRSRAPRTSEPTPNRS